jgi:predicted Zn-dependent protease
VDQFMELNLDEILQKGIEAYGAGQVLEAEIFFDQIIKSQPYHPVANHKMGILAFGEGRMQEALAYFKIALEADLNMGEYWLNYIDALLELDKLDDAKAIFDQARHKGAEGEAFDLIGKRLSEPNIS